MGKVKYFIIPKHKIEEILFSSKLLSQSLENPSVIIKQFNTLTTNLRIEISKEWSRREEVLKINLLGEEEDTYITYIMVELNIVASKYDIDPATVCMCISPPCKINEKIIVK